MQCFGINDFSLYKTKSQKITMVTTYDFTSAQIVAASNIDLILVGDSLGMVIQGQPNTITVTLNDVLYHTKAVRSGAPNTFIVADMPYLSYHCEIIDTVRNAGLLICSGGANAVKLEVNHESTLAHIDALIAAQIPVIGHIGMTPQSVNVFGGFKVQGKTLQQSEHILKLATKLEQCGVSALVLECIPANLARHITEQLTIPTIGIGAGNECDGQVLVFHDLLGLNEQAPRFSKKYLDARTLIAQSLNQFVNEVRTGEFPELKHSFKGITPCK